MSEYPTDVSKLHHNGGGPLVCHGCAHSAGSAAYPGSPSGERSCCFCVRNVQREEWRKDGGPHMKDGVYGVSFTANYDNSPMRKCPMDCYIATDRLMATMHVGELPIT